MWQCRKSCVERSLSYKLLEIEGTVFMPALTWNQKGGRLKCSGVKIYWDKTYWRHIWCCYARVIIQTLLNEEKSKSYIALNSINLVQLLGEKWINRHKKKEYKYDAELAHWCTKEDYLNKRNLSKK